MGSLIPEEPFHEAYFTVDGVHPFNWTRIPLIPFKRDSDEIPLIRNVKSLQDGLNSILSNFENNMEEDARNTILILVNYDGENLGEFRRNLSQYGAVKVRTVDGAAGDCFPREPFRTGIKPLDLFLGHRSSPPDILR